MQQNIAQFASRYARLVEAELERRLPLSALQGAERLNEALRYSVISGGKRMRPVLALLAARICGTPAEAAAGVAAGLEFLHVSSLIFDDLPAMDDAALRRGIPALHIAFGQDVAILAALALLNQAYREFARVPGLLEDALEAIGPNGMTGGQVADLQASPSPDRLRKTTALLRLTMLAGARAAGAPAEQAEDLARYGELAGEAYQICDDVLDLLATEEATGKTAGQDQRHARHSTAGELGAAGALARARELAERAGGIVRARFGPCPETDLLREAAWMVTAQAARLVESHALDNCSGVLPGGGAGQRLALAAGAEGDRAT